MPNKRKSKWKNLEDNTQKNYKDKEKTPAAPECSKDALQSNSHSKERRVCCCEAKNHKLINNCLGCGRIVCEQEGSGPCFTCATLVCTNEEREIINRNTQSSTKLYLKLLGENKPNIITDVIKNSDSLSKAIHHKDKLLEYNDTVARRTKVIDDENDFFDPHMSKWLTPEAKKTVNKMQAEAERKASDRTQKITFDFAGRQIIEEKSPQSVCEVDIDELLSDNISIFDTGNFIDDDENIGNIDIQYIETNRVANRRTITQDKRQHVRIQDKELQMMSDEGMCLSIRQPYASLLVSGVKKHECRDWYTSYRGRLWIHAAAHIPQKSEIEIAKELFHNVAGDVEFLGRYPTGCLLGHVDLVECLPQEIYRAQFPKGECASSFVFVCENPQELKVKIPMRGKGKIFKMEKHLLQAAKKTLQRL